jgi:integrase
VLYVSHSKNETSKRRIPLNTAARGAIEWMLKRADDLGHTAPTHYLWCASQQHKHDPTKPARKWDGAWRSLRKAAGLPGFRFHDLRHTVVTDLLEAGEPEHVIEAVTGHLSRRMLEHYSHQRLKAKGQMLTRMEERRKKKSALTMAKHAHVAAGQHRSAVTGAQPSIEPGSGRDETDTVGERLSTIVDCCRSAR